jgi:penicillin-binding protein 1A
MTLRDGLIYSKNTITAQVMQLAGVKRVIHLAWAFGVRESKLEPVPSLALGVSPVTLREMVSVYGTIADGGHYIAPTVVSSIEDRDGRVLATFGAQREVVPVIPTTQTLELIDAMRGVVTKGTGKAIRKQYKITADVAGKTGTTQENTDAWFIMMHPQLVAGVRVGFNERTKMGAWGTGARAALPIVAEVFQQALRHEWIDPRAQFGKPYVPIDPRYGMRDEGPGWAQEELEGVRDKVRGLFR